MASTACFFCSALRVPAGTFMLANGIVFSFCFSAGILGDDGCFTGVAGSFSVAGRAAPGEWVVGGGSSHRAAGRQQVAEPDAVVELGADAVGDDGDDFAAVPARVDVDAE